MDFVEYVANKDWVSEDEEISALRTTDISSSVEQQDLKSSDVFGNLMVKWTAPESYIPEVAFRMAQEDGDVCVGDIYLNEGFIVLMDNRDGDWD